MWIILRKYKTNKIYKDKFNLEYNERVVAYNYKQNKIMNFALVDDFTTLLHNNKHKFKTNRIDLLFVLYQIEDKKQYKNKNISKYINKLQNKIK